MRMRRAQGLVVMCCAFPPATAAITPAHIILTSQRHQSSLSAAFLRFVTWSRGPPYDASPGHIHKSTALTA